MSIVYFKLSHILEYAQCLCFPTKPDTLNVLLHRDVPRWKDMHTTVHTSTILNICKDKLMNLIMCVCIDSCRAEYVRRYLYTNVYTAI